MNKSPNKILLLIIAVLLLTNIAVLGYFLWYRDDSTEAAKKNGATELLKEQVGFSEEQITRYKGLRDRQKETIRPMYEEMRTIKDSLFRLIGDTLVSNETLNRITDQIGQKQKSLDLMTFRHFSELRNICTPDQRPSYDSMVVQMFRRMGRPQPHKDQKK